MTDREAIRQASILVTVLLTDEIITKKEAEILRQALDHVPDTTKMIEPDMGIDRGAWDGVPDATKWVDELRGGDETEEEEEPVAWSVPGFGFLFPDEYSAQRYLNNVESAAKPTPLYTAPPKREWVGLTDEEFRHAYNEWCLGDISTVQTLYDIIEAKLKEKNT